MPRAAGQVHQCPDCSKTFSRAEFVLRHQRIKHLGVRPYQCPCGISYARSDLLYRHKKKCPKAGDSPTDAVDIEDDALESPEVEIAGADAPSKRRRSNDDSNSETSGSQRKAKHKSSGDSASSPSGSSTSGTSVEDNCTAAGKPHRHGVDCEAILDRQDGDVIVLGSANKVFESVNKTSTTDLRRWSKPFPVLDPPAGRDNGWEEAPRTNYRSVAPEKAIWLESVDPDFLLTHEPVTSPYYLSPSAYSLAFICQRACGNRLPAVGTLSKFVRTAAETFLPFMPIYHIPTLNASQSPIHHSYALAVAGAACENDQEAKEFADKSLIPKRDSVQRTFDDLPAHEDIDVRFRLLQTILLYQMLAVYNRDENRRDSAQKFVDQLVRNFRSLPIQQAVLDAPDYVELVLNGSMKLESAWHKWIRTESIKRTVFLVLIATQQCANPPTLRLEDVDLPLPCHEDLWNARTDVEWLQKMAARGSNATPRLSQALFGVGPDGLPIPQWMLGNFAGTVLTAALTAAMKAGWTPASPVA